MRVILTDELNINWTDFNNYVRQKNSINGRSDESYNRYKSAVDKELSLYHMRVVDWTNVRFRGGGEIMIDSEEHFTWFILRWT